MATVRKTPSGEAPVIPVLKPTMVVPERNRPSARNSTKTAIPKPVVKPLVPSTPEPKKTGASNRKRLSKAFTRPLEKKMKKEKLVRERFTFPEAEYEQLAQMKKRLVAQDIVVKKSELVRAGLILLAALDDDDLKAALAKVASLPD